MKDTPSTSTFLVLVSRIDPRVLTSASETVTRTLPVSAPSYPPPETVCAIVASSCTSFSSVPAVTVTVRGSCQFEALKVMRDGDTAMSAGPVACATTVTVPVAGAVNLTV